MYDKFMPISELEYILRLLSAILCGALIGVEREKRLKNAGIRTHIIVAMASSLMMMVSKYGFFDVIIHDSISLDPSRIAAGVVTAIGFLGAGVIMLRHDAAAIGLTTAAGIWATVGVGITLGAGMYALGFTSTVLIYLVQVILHSHKLSLMSETAGEFSVDLQSSSKSIDDVKEILKESLTKKLTYLMIKKIRKRKNTYILSLLNFAAITMSLPTLFTILMLTPCCAFLETKRDFNSETMI